MAVVRYELIPVNELILDVKNPRIAKWMEMYAGELTDEQMALALGAGDSLSGESGTTFSSLKQSIRTNGGIIHPIIVNRETDGLAVVIEGNTRTMIYREFLKKGVPGDWSKIPAVVYAGLQPDEIDSIRLQAHLVGPRQWDPYSKAKYLDYLYNSEHINVNQIIDFCGGNKRDIHQNIAAYQDMESYYRPLVDDQDFDPSRFSAFKEYQKKPQVHEAITIAGYKKEDFSKWVNEGLFDRLEHVRKLPLILRNLKSLDIFLKDGSREAIKLLEVPVPETAIKEASLYHLVNEITRRINDISLGEILRLRGPAAGDERELLRDANDSLKLLCAEIDSDD